MFSRFQKVRIIAGKYKDHTGEVQAVEPFEVEVDVRVPVGVHKAGQRRSFIIKPVMIRPEHLRDMEQR